MKIAVFMSNHPQSGWSMGEGLTRTLIRMRHEAISVPMPTQREAPQEMIDAAKRYMPKIETLAEMDAIIVSGPEHLAPWIDAVYGKYEWKNLAVPKACWLHESCSREDFEIDFDPLKWVGDEWFFPAIQDAEFHDQEMFCKGRSHYLPFGVDTEVFRPAKESCGPYMWDESNSMHPVRGPDCVKPKTIFDIGFIGMMYQKRQIFLNALCRHKVPPIRYGDVDIRDLHGFQREETVRRIASNTREIKVFLNLPSLSRLLVSKVTETMACGTFLMTPILPDRAIGNMAIFEDKKHLIYYSASNLGYAAQQLREWISPEKDAERARIAEAGSREVHQRHNLTVRLNEMFAKMKLAQAVQ